MTKQFLGRLDSEVVCTMSCTAALLFTRCLLITSASLEELNRGGKKKLCVEIGDALWGKPLSHGCFGRFKERIKATVQVSFEGGIA